VQGKRLSLKSKNNIFDIENMLSTEDSDARHRQVYILTGSETWQKKVLKNILSKNKLDSLWVAGNEVTNIPFVSFKKSQSYLGKEKKIVVFDANKDFHPDSFAAISGIVVGGGLFVLLLPEVERWNTVYASLFGQRMIESIKTATSLKIINESEEEYKLSLNEEKQESYQSVNTPFLTEDQKQAVLNMERRILGGLNEPTVLLADRGRGKSAALGLLAARLLKSGIKNIAITAPRLRATDIFFKHVANTFPDAEFSRGKIIVGHGSINFYSPDELISENIDVDLLLIDEAAAIPIPLLSSFLIKYKQCIFSTTVHGYEGTGRGFSLKFFKILDRESPNWLKLSMTAPIRWADNDPLEKWMFHLLCLDADVVSIDSLGKIEFNNLKYCLLRKQQLYDSNDLLNEVFSLLVLAHYRTSPSDLKALLDNDDVSVYVTLYNHHVIAVALVSREGSFSQLLATDIYRGKRRPKGHLLAQALTYHCGIENAATLDYARVMRIAVHPKVQNKYIGSTLLQFIIDNEKLQGRDGVGTSFGMNSELLTFWARLDFNLVRIGFTREQTSGEHAAIMLLGLTDRGEDISKEAIDRFNGQSRFWFEDILKDIPLKLKDEYLEHSNDSLALSEFDIKDLQSFCDYSRNYELCIAAINKLVMIKNDSNIKDSELINNKIVKKLSWKNISVIMNLKGQAEARKLFQVSICSLMDK